MLHAFCYHRIVEHEPAHDFWGLAVTRARFQQQIEVLSGRMTLLDLSRVPLLEAIEEKQHYALITFDDIYYEVLELALPVLESFNASALLFISGGFLGHSSFWWDQVEALSADLDEATRHDFIDRTWQWLRDLPLNEKLMVLGHMLRLQPTAALPKDCRPLTHEEVRQIADHPCVWFGGHTMTHPWLPALDAAAITEEIQAGTELLRHLTAKEPLAFAYPYGAWNGNVREAVSQSGYNVAFTTERPCPYPAERGNLDLLAFPRMCVQDWSPSELLSNLS